jgi:hypothetical protein
MHSDDYTRDYISRWSIAKKITKNIKVVGGGGETTDKGDNGDENDWRIFRAIHFSP